MFLICGVPHESLLRPALFVTYIVDELILLIESSGLSPLFHVDDIQVYSSCPHSVGDEFSSTISVVCRRRYELRKLELTSTTS